jgi:hypothetical protein
LREDRLEVWSSVLQIVRMIKTSTPTVLVAAAFAVIVLGARARVATYSAPARA